MATEVGEYFGFLWVYVPVGKVDDDCEGCWKPLPWGTPRWRRKTHQYDLRLMDLPSVICVDCQFGVAMADWEDFVEERYPELFKRPRGPGSLPRARPPVRGAGIRRGAEGLLTERSTAWQTSLRR